MLDTTAIIQGQDTRHVTGHVGSGNMKINEFTELDVHNKFPFDIVDDALTFMKNDPIFYRKKYYPTIAKIADSHRGGKNIDSKKTIMPMIEEGLQGYCNAYLDGQEIDDVFNNDDRNNLYDLIYSSEMNQIKKGDYL